MVLLCPLPTREEDYEHLILCDVVVRPQAVTCAHSPAEQGLSHLPSQEMTEQQLYILSGDLTWSHC